MITSASGTASIMRRCAISCCTCRTFDLTSGLPSVSFNSSRTSCSVIFSFCEWSQSWNGTSIAAISISVEDTTRKLRPSSQAPLSSASDSDCVPSPINSSALLHKKVTATLDTTRNLATALISSIRPLLENMRLKPAIGLIRSALKAIDSTLKDQPPIAKGVKIAITVIRNMNGPIAVSAS